MTRSNSDVPRNSLSLRERAGVRARNSLSLWERVGVRAEGSAYSLAMHATQPSEAKPQSNRTPMRHYRVAVIACLMWLTMLSTTFLHAQEPAAARAEDKLAVEQQRIADKYEHLEDVLLRMAELTASTDPRRAALLRKAVAQSKERLVGVQFDRTVKLLDRGQLSRALENQQELNKDLRALLELLMSENRAKQLESEKARIRQYLKHIKQLIRRQKGIQGRTEGGGDPERLAKEQERLANRTGNLAKEIHRNEEDQGKAAPGDGKAKAPSKDAGKDAGKGKEQGGRKSNAKAEGQGQGQGQGKEQEQGQGAGQGGDPKSSQQENPARKRLDAARQRMKEAQEKLDKAEREGAVEQQEEALRELEQARADLEEILRQLREEEIERTLVMLEARFRKMLEMQRTVYTGTQRLNKVPPKRRTHDHEIEAGRLSNSESLIVLEADKALALLRDDASAVAFPEAVHQLRADMQQVVVRLAQAKVGPITQAIEEDVIAALEEMIEALQKAIEEAEQKKQQPPPSQQGRPQDPPLVDALAELKMIRALQIRVNRRTTRYAKLLDGPQAEETELLEALRRLAERESRIHRITRDLQMGKNQ